jgi:hypothetical protein
MPPAYAQETVVCSWVIRRERPVGEGDDIVAQPGGVVRVVGEQVNDRPHLSGEQRQLSHIQSWFIVPAFA